MSNEPVIGMVVGLIVAGVGLLVAFGVNVTQEQTAAIVAFAGAALGLGFYVRSKVTPESKGLSRKDLKNKIERRTP